MYQYKAYIDRVIDGDTVVCDIDLGFYTWLKNLHLRFYGIDAPEKSDPTGWKLATDYVQAFFDTNPVVTTDIYGMDKYGRWLAVFIDPANEVTLNQQLVDKGLAKIYLP